MINKYFDKIYYINLDRDEDRKDYIINLCKKYTTLSNELIRFPGIDGRTIDINTIDKNIISDNARQDILSGNQRIFGITLTYGSLGCALSHKKIWEECADSSKPYLIFEDDIIIDNTFDNKLIEILQYLSQEDYDICYLGCYEIPGLKQTEINTVLCKPSGLVTGLYGYIVTPSGANKLLGNIFPLTYQIDSSIGHNSKKINLVCPKTKIINTKLQFGSNTQRAKSCENIYKENNNTWNKLFS